MNLKFPGALALLTALPLMATHAHAQTARNDRAVAVPVKAPVVLDGDLAEWDWSGAIESVYDAALAPRFTAQFEFQYDAQNLYFGAKIHDDTPLQNSHDPRIEPGRGWDGDAIQLRLTTAPEMLYPLTASVFSKDDPQSKDDRIVHLTLWQFTGNQESALGIQRGMDYHGDQLIVGDQTNVVFKKWPDGKGYNIEARFPWSLLGVKAGQAPPKAGDKVAHTIQPLWGSPDGSKQIVSFGDVVTGAGFHFQTAEKWGRLEFLAKGDVTPAPKLLSASEVQLPLSFTLAPRDAAATVLSVGIWNSRNELVRTLPTATDFKTENGRVTLRWDGLDDDGRVLPSGKYVAKYLSSRGVSTKWLTSLNTVGKPPWKTGDGTGAWGADHGSPVTATSDSQRVYLGWSFSEAGFALVGAKQELKADQFGALKPQKLWGSTGSLDIGLEVQAVATDGQHLFVAQDGKMFGQHTDPNALNIGGILLWDTTKGKPVNFPFGKRVLKVSEWKAAPEDDSKRLNVFAIAVAGDRLFVSLYHDGEVRQYNWKTGEMVQKWPVASPRGLAVAGDGTVRVLSGTQLLKINPRNGAESTLVAGLSDPYGLALARDGALFVSDRGAAQQVKIFAANGKPMGTLGKSGGRAPVGRWDATGMLNPAGLTVDAAGKIWVTEQGNSPRRISVWNRSGKLLADLLGPGWYAVQGNADPLNPRRVSTNGAFFDVDYTTGKNTILGVPLQYDRHTPRLVADGADYRFHRVNGRTYLSQHGTALYLLDEKTLIARPVSAIGRPPELAAFFNLTTDMFPAAQRAAMQELLADGGATLIWTDRNGDGLMQPVEFVRSRAAETPYLYWGGHFDEGLTLWSAMTNDSGKMFKIGVKSFLPDGTPDYGDLSDLKPLLTTRGTSSVSSVLPSLDRNSVYSVETADSDKYQAVARYNLDGIPRWAYRRTWTNFALSSPLYRPGMVIGAMKLIGVEPAPASLGGEIVGVNGYHGQFNLLSGDGLWIGALGSDNRYSPENSDKTYFVENFSGSFFRNRENGKYYLIAGETDTRISEITGLDTLQKGEEDLGISPTDAALARTSLDARGTGGRPLVPLSLRLMTPPLEGDLSAWKLPETPQIDGGAGRTAKVALGYDAQNLYLAFDVKDTSPLKNAGGDDSLLFKTGDSVNLNLATDPNADPNRTKPVAGDIRLLLTETPEGAIAVLYEPVASPGTGKTPRNFVSPTGAETFERVLTLEGAKIVIGRRADGYSLEAAIPLAALGFKPQPGQTLKGDVGVLFSTPGGNAVGLRAYAFNKDTQITQDVPSEARLEPNKWGTFKVE